ncbi:hypothetical protein GCM10020227_54450 [Streptomyces flavovirens]
MDRDRVGEQLLDGLTVDTSRPEQPILLDEAGRAIKTWRENYPYDRKVRRKEYERVKRILQIELLKLQRWTKDTGARVVVVCEGRDAAGKGGTIQRFTERLNPRGARIVALDKPTDRERGQWYFQRYVAHLPAPGELVFFDRSWYNRAGVERVMGFCTPREYELFLKQCPVFEEMLVDDGIVLVKFWFSVSRAEQRTRFAIRQVDPVRQWKLSPTDVDSLDRWDDYTHGEDRHVPRHRHRARAVDGGEEQRQAPGPPRSDAQPPGPRRLRREGPRRRRQAGPARRGPRRDAAGTGRGGQRALAHPPRVVHRGAGRTPVGPQADGPVPGTRDPSVRPGRGRS